MAYVITIPRKARQIVIQKIMREAGNSVVLCLDGNVPPQVNHGQVQILAAEDGFGFFDREKGKRHSLLQKNMFIGWMIFIPISQDSPAAEDTSHNARCSDDIASCHKNDVCPMVGFLRDIILVDETGSIPQHAGEGFSGQSQGDAKLVCKSGDGSHDWSDLYSAWSHCGDGSRNMQ